MKRYLTWIILIGAGLALTGAMVNPVYHSSVYIGGGPSDPDGGAQIENTGDAEFSGTVKIGELETDALTAEGELTITGDLSVTGDFDIGGNISTTEGQIDIDDNIDVDGNIGASGNVSANGILSGATANVTDANFYDYITIGQTDIESGSISLRADTGGSGPQISWDTGTDWDDTVSRYRAYVLGQDFLFGADGVVLGFRLYPSTDTIQTYGKVSCDDEFSALSGTFGVNGAGGTAATVTLRDGANPGSTETLTYAKWNSLNDTNGIVKCNGSGTFSAASAGTDYCAAAGGTGVTTLGTITTGTWNAGAVTSSGALTGTSAVIGGGYGSTGATISDAGAISADGDLTITKTAAAAGVILNTYRDANGGSYVMGQTARGTQASPTQTQSGDSCLRFLAYGLDNGTPGAFQAVSVVTLAADGNITNTSAPGKIIFSVTPSASTTPAAALTIASTKYLVAPGVYTQTSASATNVVVDSSGNLMRSTSSAKYKTEIEDLNGGTKALDLRPVKFRSVIDEERIVRDRGDKLKQVQNALARAQAAADSIVTIQAEIAALPAESKDRERASERLAESQSEAERIPQLQDELAAATAENQKPVGKQQFIGLIAEEVAEVDPLLVTFDADGAPDAVQYDRVCAYLIDLAKEQQSRIEEQDITIEDLVKRVEKLEKDSGGGQRADAGVPYDDDNSIPDGADDLVCRPGLDSSPAMALLMGNN